MTRIVLNAISVKEGGSLVVLRELLVAMAARRPEWRWTVVANSELTGLPVVGGVDWVAFPSIDRSGVRVRAWYEHGLPRLLSAVGADVLFSQTNYLPRRPLSCPSLLLMQHAGHFSPVFDRLTLESTNALGRLAWNLKRRWVYASVRAASLVTVQTDALAREVVRATGCRGTHVRVVPHGVGQAVSGAMPRQAPAPGAPSRVGYVTKHGVQKNFGVLLQAVARLRQQGVPTTLVLTLDPSLQAGRQVLDEARGLGLESALENHGELAPAEVNRLYRSLHAFAFPSLCESFGFPMVEAMAHGLPLLVADVPSNVEVAGAAGIPFPPTDAAALAAGLQRLASDSAWFSDRARASLARAADFTWSRAAEGTIALLEELMRR